MSLSSIKDKMKVIYAYLPERDLKAQHRIVKNEEKHIQVIYTKGEEDTYKMWIHKNEINENIFTLEIFISTYHMDMPDAVRHHQMYNQEKFIIFQNQNGFFPIKGNEYYLINDSESKIYEIIVDGQVHKLSVPSPEKIKKLSSVFCKYKNHLYTIPLEYCD